MFEFHVGNLYTRLNKKKATVEELKLLHKQLSVKVPGHYFSPHFKRGLWDGYRRFFNLLTSTLYTGLLHYAIRKLSEAGVNVETECKIVDEREKVEHQNNPISLDGIELRDYQEVMINEAVKKERGIISAPPNAGKTEVACGIVQVLGLPANFFTHRLTLLRQTKERFEKRLGIEVGIIGGGEEDIKEVNVLSVASVVRKLDEPYIKELLKNTPVIISDECFLPETKVLVDFGIAVPIKKIYSSEKINYVLSYNHEIGSFEKRKIVRKIRKELDSKYLIHLYVEFKGKIRKVTCTPNHKIFVNGSYTEANSIKVGDKVKVIDKDFITRYGYSDSPKKIVCRKCGEEFLTRSEFSKHHMAHYKDSEVFEENIKKAGRIRGDQIKGEGNPSKNPTTLKKIVAGRKKWWDSLPEEERQRKIRTFINAPYYNRERKSSFERIVDNLGIPELKYTGDGSKFIILPDGRRKNPDFLFEDSKVIEVADTEYWHSIEELSKLRHLYSEVGYECLILTNKDLSDSNLKGRVLKFLFNCEGVVTRINRQYSSDLQPHKHKIFIYNLEIDGNHNYFANNILVSNCHHITAKTWEKCLKLCEGAYYRYGLSATPLLRDEISNMIVRGLTGDEIVAVTNKELIESGVSALPSVYLLNVREPKIPAHYTFDQAYDIGILRNDYRNRLIVNSTKHFLAQDKSVFILVWRIEHGEILLDQLQKEGIESEFISGQDTNTGQVQNVLKRFSKKELKCVVSSTISDEGIDVPALDVLIMGVGFKAPLKTIQRVGRGLRKKTVGENVVTIVDFVDWHSRKYLYKHSIDRAREYVNMGIRIFEVMDSEWKVVEER